MDETTLKPARSKGLMLIAVVFLLGMICGASLFYLGQRSVLVGQAMRPPQARGFGGPPGGEHHERAMERISKELGLDPEQRQQITTILRESRMRVHRVVEDSRAEIGELLTDEQKQKLDELLPPGRILPARRSSSSQTAASTYPGIAMSHQANCTRSRRSTPRRRSERSTTPVTYSLLIAASTSRSGTSLVWTRTEPGGWRRTTSPSSSSTPV